MQKVGSNSEMLTYDINLIFFLVKGSTRGEMARQSVLKTLHSNHTSYSKIVHH